MESPVGLKRGVVNIGGQHCMIDTEYHYLAIGAPTKVRRQDASFDPIANTQKRKQIGLHRKGIIRQTCKGRPHELQVFSKANTKRGLIE